MAGPGHSDDRMVISHPGYLSPLSLFLYKNTIRKVSYQLLVDVESLLKQIDGLK